MTEQQVEEKCPTCGSVMLRDCRPDVIEYKGQSRDAMQPGWYCTNCDEVLMSHDDMMATDGIYIELRAEVEGVLTPQQVKEIRLKLNLSQRKAGAILGGGPRAFQKYEVGGVMPSRAISNLLRLLDRDPSQLAVLEEISASPVEEETAEHPAEAASP